MTTLPLVTIGMPVFNGETYIVEALESLLAQDYWNFEINISDNGSTDRTEEICRTYETRDSRIHYCRDEVNRGASANFNRVARLGSGKYFMWAADHDLRQATFISHCVEVLEKQPAVVLCYPQAVWIDSEGAAGGVIHPFLDTRGLTAAARLHVILWGLDYCYQIYGVFRSDILKSTRVFHDIVAPDLLLLAELSLLGEFACVSEPLLQMRKMPDYGDWGSYTSKLTIGKGTRCSGIKLFCNMICHHLAVIRMRVPSIRGKIFLMLSVAACMLGKYRWIVRGLLSAATK